jgi:hypothetical protein
MLHTRCDAALRDARADYERTVVVLREENATLRRMLEAAQARVDALTTDLVKSLAVTAPPVPTAPASLPRRTPTDPIRGLGNLLDEVPFGDPAGSFADATAASIMAAEDDDGAPASAAA